MGQPVAQTLMVSNGSEGIAQTGLACRMFARIATFGEEQGRKRTKRIRGDKKWTWGPCLRPIFRCGCGRIGNTNAGYRATRVADSSPILLRRSPATAEDTAGINKARAKRRVENFGQKDCEMQRNDYGRLRSAVTILGSGITKQITMMK
jgi:hypothetical protein